MTNEFKKITEGDTTRFVLESASVGSTSDAAVNTGIASPMGAVRRRPGADLINQEINTGIKNKVHKTELENQRWDMMNNLDWLIAGGGWFENEIPLSLNREKRKKPTKVKEGLTQEEIDFLKSTLNKQLEELHSNLEYYSYAYTDTEEKELFWKLKNRDSSLIKKLAEIQRKLKRGLPK